MTNSHRACNHPTTSSARATCRRERAAAADALRVEYAHVLAKRVLFSLEDCDVCDDATVHHARHYGLVRDVILNPRWAEPMLWVWDEATMSEREIGLSEAEFVD
jgi:hypothetical protein